MPFNVGGTTVITDDRLVSLTSGATASRPASPTTGQLWYNTTTAVLEVWNGSAWRPAGTSGSGNVTPLWSWGWNISGQLGDNTTNDVSSPVSVVGGFTDWVQVSGGDLNSAAIRANGTAWGWGYNTRGAIGDNTTVGKSSPVSVVGGFTDWVQISVGLQHTAAIRANGTAWTWGTNQFGQLGDNTNTSRSSPGSVVGGFTNWIQISAGKDFTMGLRANGTLWGWGAGGGQIGDGTITSKISPVSVVGGFTDWVQVFSSYSHTLAVRANGTAWAWGQGNSGRLGDNTTVTKSSPVSVVGGFTDWVQVAAGNYHSLGIRANGTAWAWGRNVNGQLGDGTSGAATSKLSPVSVVGGFTDWVQISSGIRSTSSVAIRANGTAWSWGNAGAGALGDGTTVAKSSPVSVVGGFTDWIQVSAGRIHAVALRAV